MMTFKGVTKNATPVFRRTEKAMLLVEVVPCKWKACIVISIAAPRK